MKPAPSPKMQKFLDAYDSINEAAVAWGVEYLSLKRFVDGEGGLTLATAMKISKVTGVPMDELYQEGAKR